MNYEKMSAAKRRYWAKYTPEERKEIISARAKKFWSKKTPEERKARSILMRANIGKKNA
jgi:predicted Fe-S protein YdhL (DUF1289 family)